MDVWQQKELLTWILTAAHYNGHCPEVVSRLPNQVKFTGLEIQAYRKNNKIGPPCWVRMCYDKSKLKHSSKQLICISISGGYVQVFNIL